jgi:hypothetical protein
MPVFVDVNIVAVIVAGIVSMVTGLIWYGPLFGKKWMALHGKTMKDFEAMKGDMPKMYAQGFVLALVTAYVLAWNMGAYAMIGPVTMIDGAIAGFFVWLGFVATTQYGGVLWEGMRKKVFLLNTLYSLVNLLIIGALLASWM